MSDIFRQPLLTPLWRAPRSVELLTWVQEKTQEAVVTETVNPGFNEWAVPPGPRGLAPQDYPDPSNLALLSTPAQLPAPQNDWPNPRGRPPLNLSFADSFKLPLQQTLPPHQTDWPVPKGRPPTPQDWRDSFKLPLQQVLPPDQTDWPNPRGPRQSRQDWILSQPYVLNVVTEVVDPAFNHLGNPFQILRSINFLTWLQSKTQEAAAANPFVPVDFPNPRGRAPLNLSFADSFKLPLQQIIQPNQYDWPNPVLRTVQRTDWRDWFKLPLQGVIQPNQYSWPNPPLAAKRNPQDWQQSTSIALSGAVLPPFFETEWPNPVLRTIQRRDWADSFKLPLQQTIQSNQYNWPNPPLAAKRNPQDWLDWFKLPLQQTLPPSQLDWPNPRGPLPARFDWLQPKTQETAAAVTVNPGFNEWAVPSGPYRPLYDWILPQPAVFNAPENEPGGIVGWGNPLLGQKPRQDWIFPLPYTLNVVVAANPFVPEDWPNPRGPAPRQTSFTDSFKLPLQQTLPENQYDWPNPVLAKRNPQDWLLSTSIALSTAVQPPFFETDWPNPTLRTVQRRDWSDSFKLPLQQVIQPNQYNWPNPLGPRRNPQDWIQATSIALTSAVVQNPFFQTNWPNPRQALRGSQDWIAQPYALITPVTDLGFNLWGLPERPRRNPQDWQAHGLPGIQPPPPTNYDWPNPQRQRLRVFDWIQGTAAALRVVQAPFAQKDWPNPRRVLRSNQDWIGQPFALTKPVTDLGFSLWGLPQRHRLRVYDWINSTPIALNFAPPPVYDADNTLKNEIRRLRFLDNKTGRVRFLKNEIRR